MKEVKSYLLLDNLVCLSATRVIRGAVLENNQWIPANDRIVPARVFIQAGSVIEKAWPVGQINKLVDEGIITSVGERRHFDLDKYYPDEVVFMGQKQPLAKVLQAHGLNTLESVARNEMGKCPLSEMAGGGSPVPASAKEVLGFVGDESQVEIWIHTAKSVLEEVPIGDS